MSTIGAHCKVEIYKVLEYCSLTKNKYMPFSVSQNQLTFLYDIYIISVEKE